MLQNPHDNGARNALDAIAPALSGDPAPDKTVPLDTESPPLLRVEAVNMEAITAQRGRVLFRWYQGGAIIDGAVSPAFTPPVNRVGTVNYYVEAVNTIPDNGDGGMKRTAVYGLAGKIAVQDKLDLSIPRDAGAGETRRCWRFSHARGTYILENGSGLLITGNNAATGYVVAVAPNGAARESAAATKAKAGTLPLQAAR